MAISEPAPGLKAAVSGGSLIWTTSAARDNAANASIETKAVVSAEGFFMAIQAAVTRTVSMTLRM